MSPEALVPTRYVRPCAIWSSENQYRGPLGILEQTRKICHGLHRLWIPPVVIRIKVPGRLLDMHLAAEGMLDPFL